MDVDHVGLLSRLAGFVLAADFVAVVFSLAIAAVSLVFSVVYWQTVVEVVVAVEVVVVGVAVVAVPVAEVDTVVGWDAWSVHIVGCKVVGHPA